MVLSTRNFEYALQLQSAKNDLFSLIETSQKCIHALRLYLTHFTEQGCINILQVCLNLFSSL